MRQRHRSSRTPLSVSTHAFEALRKPRSRRGAIILASERGEGQHALIQPKMRLEPGREYLAVGCLLPFQRLVILSNPCEF